MNDTKKDGIPRSKPIPYFRQYEIMRDGTIFNTKTRKILKPRGEGMSVSLTTDKGTYTTRTVKGLLDATWNKTKVSIN